VHRPIGGSGSSLGGLLAMWLRSGEGRKSAVALSTKLRGNVGELPAGVPGIIAQQLEGLVHVDTEALGELAPGLLDDDPAVRAPWSCSATTSLRRTYRSCSSPIVATSARACPMRRPGGSDGPGPARNRFSAPMTQRGALRHASRPRINGRRP
jgi:hypothetical protein